VRWLMLCFALFFCLACDVERPRAVVKIGAIFSESGRYAFVGKPGAELLRGLKVDGIEFVVRDSQGDRALCQRWLTEFAKDPNFIGVVGPSTSDETLAVIDSMPEPRLVCLSISASDRLQSKHPWVFRLPVTSYHMVYQMQEHLLAHNLRKVALISVDSSFGRSGRREFLAQAEAAGIDLSADVVSPDRSLAAQESEALVAKALASQPQALVCWWSATGAVQLTLAARRLGLKVPLYHSGGVAGPEFLEATGSASEGILFPGAHLLVSQDLPSNHPQFQAIQRFKSHCSSQNLVPGNFSGYAWDGAQFLVKAYREVGRDRVKIRAYLENLQNEKAVSGVYSFSSLDHNGLGHDSFRMLQIGGGTWR